MNFPKIPLYKLAPLLKPLRTAALIGLSAYLVFQAPQLQRSYLRSEVGSQVYMITNEEGSSGGTGFSVKGPSGKVYTLTNAHVCGLAKNNTVWASSATMRKVPLQVIEESKDTDLCLLSAVAGKSGLDVASKDVYPGQELNIVGHPMLMPITLTRGEMMGYETVVVGVSEGPCAKEEGMYKTVDAGFYYVCAEVIKAGLTSVPSFGGNSGSPVIDNRGNVIGVLFAGDNRINWGIIIQLSDVQTFLKPY